MNLAPSNPSTTRWSAVNVNVIIGLTVTSPLYTTGFGTVALTPKNCCIRLVNDWYETFNSVHT